MRYFILLYCLFLSSFSHAIIPAESINNASHLVIKEEMTSKKEIKRQLKTAKKKRNQLKSQTQKLKWQLFKDTDVAEKVMSFFPLESMADLIVEPVTRLGGVQTLANQVGEELSKDYAVHWYTILIVLIWTAIFIYGSYAVLKKRDL